MTTETSEVQAAKSRTDNANDLLGSVKGKFDEIVVIGLKNGVVDVAPSVPTYQFVQWLLSRAAFELNIAEKANLVAEKTPEVVS